MTDQLLTIDEAAAYLGVNKVKFARIVKGRPLPRLRDRQDQRVKLFRPIDLDTLKRREAVEVG